MPLWTAASAILWLAASVYSTTALVPINNHIASWATVPAPADWKVYRRRWELLHRCRVALLTIALAFLIIGISGAPASHASLAMKFASRPMYGAYR